MKWFVLVVLMGLHPDGTQDTYIYNDIGLRSLEQCQSWVAGSSRSIRLDMMNKFEGKPIQSVYCINEERLRQFLELNSKPGKDI